VQFNIKIHNVLNSAFVGGDKVGELYILFIIIILMSHEFSFLFLNLFFILSRYK
jgi:hypothetical protein